MMKRKLIVLSLLFILLVSPVCGFAYAQEDPVVPTNSTEPSDPIVPPEPTNSTDPVDPPVPTNSTDPVEPTNSTDPVDGEGASDGNIDPVIYDQIQKQAQERFQEMYVLMFGEVTPEPETPADPVAPSEPANSTDPTEPLVPTNSTDPVVPTDPTNSTDPVVPSEPTNSTDLVEGEELPEYDGPVVPEDVDPALRNQFMNAWSAMQSAETKENPRASANQYLRAMKQLRNAYRKYQKDNPEVVEDLVPEGAEGVPEGEVPDEPTPEELDEVQTELVGRFQERFQERVTQMLENYNDVEDTLSPGDAVKAFDALTKAEAKLLRIQERISSGEVEGAIDDLDNATGEMEDDFDSMDDAASSQMMKTMNKLEARITKMTEQAARKAAKGEDTSEINADIAAVRGNKDKTKTDFKEDKEKGSSGNDKDTGKPDDKETGKPDKDTGKPDKDNNKGGKKDR